MSKKAKIIWVIVLATSLVVTGLAMTLDQAVGSCCGAREQISIEIWWWLVLTLEFVGLVFVIKRKSR